MENQVEIIKQVNDQDVMEMKTMGMNGEKLTVDIKLKGLKDVKKTTKAFRKLNQELEKTIQLVERLDDLN